MEHAKTVAVTISRQMASGGSFVAHSLARRLGFRYVDGEIISTAAELIGVKVEELSAMDERIPTLLQTMFEVFAYGTPETAYCPPAGRVFFDMEVQEVEARVIREIADHNNAVIVGRGSFYLLKQHPGLLNVFIHAPLEFRIKRLMECHRGFNEDEARTAIEESDSRRRKFIHRLTGSEWSDATNYDICIDTSRISLQKAIDLLVNLAEVACVNMH